jgi:hypothetical protein
MEESINILHVVGTLLKDRSTGLKAEDVRALGRLLMDVTKKLKAARDEIESPDKPILRIVTEADLKDTQKAPI